MNSHANEFPDLRAWALMQAERGRSASNVARELAERWGVGGIPMRKLIMEAFGVGLREANEICGVVPRAADHPLATAAHEQLHRSWMRDMSQLGSAVELSYRPSHGWRFAITRRGTTLSTGIEAGTADVADARDCVDQLMAVWSDHRIVVSWDHRSRDADHAVGVLIASTAGY